MRRMFMKSNVWSEAAPHHAVIESNERFHVASASARVGLRVRSPIRNFAPDPSSHLGEFLLCLFDVSVRVQLVDVMERHEMQVDVPHAEAFDRDTYAFSARGMPYWFR